MGWRMIVRFFGVRGEEQGDCRLGMVRALWGSRTVVFGARPFGQLLLPKETRFCTFRPATERRIVVALPTEARKHACARQ